MKRLLDCDTSDLRQMNKEQILQSLQASEGRVDRTGNIFVSYGSTVVGADQ